MIREAGETLKDQYKRRAYDIERNERDTSQKNSFREFMELQKHCMHDKQKPVFAEVSEKVMTRDEHNRRYEDTVMQREMEDLDVGQENLFEGKPFDSHKFNKIFEKHRTKSKKEKKSKCDEIVPVNNDQYAETVWFESNTSANLDDPDDLSIDFTNNTDDNTNGNTNGTGNNAQAISSAVETVANERKRQDKLFENMTDTDFGSAIDDKFGVSHGVGFLVGSNMRGCQTKNGHVANSDLSVKAYKSLVDGK